MPRSETVVMLATVGVTIATHNLAWGVGVGVVVASVLFAVRVAHQTGVERMPDEPDGAHRYVLTGALFFASASDLVHRFEYDEAPARVVLDLSGAHLWDASTVAALDGVTSRFEQQGAVVELTGLNPDSASRHARLSGHLGAEH
jgi:SulP family sulfate permease